MYSVWYGKTTKWIIYDQNSIIIASGDSNMMNVIDAVERANKSPNPNTYLAQFLATLRLSNNISVN
jgi:hypothetical protein